MKKFYFLFLMMLLPLAVSADAVQIDGIYYNLNVENQVAQVTRNPNKYSGEVLIPKSVTYEGVTYSVKSIGESAFQYCTDLASITIPNSVTSIESGAFRDCSGLTSITIPNSVTSIGYYVFNNCSGLTSIVVEAGNTVYDSRDNCNAIIETASNTLIRGCKTTVFPNNVTSIGRYAFTGCSGLTSVTIPSSVTFIENSAFSYCNDLTSIVVEAGNTEYDSRDNCNAIIRTASNYLVAGCKTTVIPDGVTRIANDAFAGHRGLTSIEIPNSVTTILGSAFHMCSGLISVTIPNSVTYIGGNAFYNCSSLTSVIIPNSVTSLDNTFNGCSGLTSVTIPNSVTSIGDYTFAGCRSLPSVEIPNSVTSIGKLAFQECKGLTSITIPNSVTSIGDRAFGSCSGLTSVTSLATTPPQADEKAFTNYDIPLYVPKGTRDAYLAASPWNKFKEIVEDDNTTNDKTKRTIHVETAGTLPDLISADEKYLIEELTLTGNLNGTDIFLIRDMAGVNLDNMLSELNPAYDGAKTNGNLKVLNLSDANIVEGGRDYYRMMWSSRDHDFGSFKYTQANAISECMFADCWRLEELILPRSVTTISSPCVDVHAYYPLLMSIKKLKVAEGNPNYISPDDCNAIIEKETKKLIAGCSTTVIPEDVTSIGANAFRDNKGLASLVIPGNVTSIGTHAFRHCQSLTSIVFPGSVTSIGDYAFWDCSGLTSVTISNSVTTIGDGAFGNCNSLKDVYCYAVNVPSAKSYTFGYDMGNVTLHVPAASLEAYKATEPWSEFGNIVAIEGSDVDEITIKDSGKTTWCSEYDLDFTDVEGVKAYTATGYDNKSKTIWLTRVSSVPAGTGILVKGDPGKYQIPRVESQSVYANFFKGNLGSEITISETDGDMTNYYLSKGQFVKVNKSATIGKNKAYLQLPTFVFAGTRSIGMCFDDEDGTTGIDEVIKYAPQSDDTFYNLQGQRVDNPGKGLYIKNGKKVIIR